MDNISTLQSGFRTGQEQTGFKAYCRYGLPHLICLAIDSPQDPLQSPSLAYLKAGEGYFAEQFLLGLNATLNNPTMLINLHRYATQSSTVQSDKPINQIINELSVLIASSKLLVFPLYDR